MSSDSATFQIPASTSNCGPGFDTLGIALSLYNFVKVELTEGNEVEPINPDSIPEQSLSMARGVCDAFVELTGVQTRGFRFDVWGEVPIARGLGSSAILRAGIVASLNQLHGSPLDVEAMIRLVARVDNAPDNATSVFKGGFVVARSDPHTNEYLESLQFPLSEDLAMVVVSPDIEVQTEVAREALPKEFPFQDAVRSINSSSYIVACLAAGEYERLSRAVSDFMHQPYRAMLCPYVNEAIDAGIAQGAYTGWLSGSGSSVLCVAPAAVALEVGKAMGDVYQQNRVQNRVFHLHTDNQGLKSV